MTTHTMHTAGGNRVGNPVEELAREVRRVFGAIAAGQQAARDYRRLQARSDAALAREGLTRQDIARTVYLRNFA